MNSRSGDRVPAGVSGEVGRGTVGTDAPTAPNGFPLFSPALWVLAFGYAAGAAVLVWLAFSLAPWGLLLLIPAASIFTAAVLTGFIAYGISRLERDNE